MFSTKHLDALTKKLSVSGNYYVVIYFVCASVGTYYSLFYLFCGLHWICLYEFCTLLIYFPVLYMARIDHPYTGPFAYVQFLHHQLFGTYNFGFESGFWMLICCLYFAHFVFFRRPWAQLGASLLTTVVLFGLYFADRAGVGVYSPNLAAHSIYADDIFASNMAMTVGFMITCGLMIHLSTNGRIDNLMHMIYKDFLTGLNNRKFIIERIWPQMSRENLCVAVADIDDFKKINDTLGHGQGDVVLKFAALLMMRACQDAKFHTELARWGGEEFLIMSQTEDKSAFFELLEHIREDLSKSQIIGDRFVSVSIGAVTDADKLGFTEAFEQADKNLYVAKRTGKNKTVI